MKHVVKLEKRSDVWQNLYVEGNLLGEFVRNRKGKWFFYPSAAWRDPNEDCGWDEQVIKSVVKAFHVLAKENR